MYLTDIEETNFNKWIKDTFKCDSYQNLDLNESEDDLSNKICNFIDNLDYEYLACHIPEFKDYNGWTNHDTWDLNLHLTNDESTFNYFLSCVEYGFKYFIKECIYYIFEIKEDWDYLNINYREIYLSFKEMYESEDY